MQEFSAKRDALFACLDDASKELRGTALDQSKAKAFSINALDRGNKSGNGSGQVMNYRQGRSIDTGLDAEDGRLRRMRGKESIFKKPELPIGRCLKPRKTPDYQVNPHKWKKYSLSDVDISEQSNSAAALSFLRQMDAQREAEGVDNESPPTDGKIEFKRTSKLSRKLKTLKQQEVEDVELDKPQLRGCKLVMPEYVIGQKPQKQRKSKTKSDQSRAAGKLQLSHLAEEDEQDD
ncbi:protein TSSC4 [Drosophila sechellia]|uniref:U5 small nuclear ribonucleoprotein TSSC4 n=1 Tax=Drosophila sechellia TaxID=7238 RepID=B4HLS2_DROSE|nr:protein TSSC4 [Drosophila sechellia]EDW40954.1 GM24827 [Drosophila sechellia]